MNKKSSILFLLLFQLMSLVSQNNYRNYHESIINAENLIFLEKDSIGGLKIFENTFKKFDFVFVDDCIEAFQLALLFKQDDYAMIFIKKAIENGFETEKLSLLKYRCIPCTTEEIKNSKTTIYIPFLAKNNKYLKEYEDKTFNNNLLRINRDLFIKIHIRHFKEQLYKNGHKELVQNGSNQNIIYKSISDSNLNFIDSLYNLGIFLGERNLGIYTNKLAKSLHFPFDSIQGFATDYFKKLNLPVLEVPYVTDYDYFEGNAISIIMFHNQQSIAKLQKYWEKAIENGYMHPREFAMTLGNTKGNVLYKDMMLDGILNETKKREIANNLRKQYLLPSIEIDAEKLKFEKKYHIQLFFGLFGTSR